MNQEQTDALRALVVPMASPSLSVIKEVTDDGKTFTLKHEPMASPPLPPAPEVVRRGKRAHVIHTLTDLRTYVDDFRGEGKPVAFYTDAGVAVVLDETSKTESEVLRCTLERHHEFERWSELMGEPLKHEQFVQFLRLNTAAIDHGSGNNSQSQLLIGIYSALSGELVHGADEFLDMQGRSATFTVRRKSRGGQPKEQEVGDVPTQFTIEIPILADDAKRTEFRVLVRMTGGPGAQVVFTLEIENFEEMVAEHIDLRLEQFATECGFLAVRGEHHEEPWKQPELPASVAKLMELQTQMIGAMRRTDR